MRLEFSAKKRIGTFDFSANFASDGKRIGVYGPSGSGKTTLMHLLAGLISPDEGAIRLDGTMLFDSSSKINLAPEKRRIAVVFQHCHLFPHLNVNNNLLYGYHRTPKNFRRIEPKTLIEVLELEVLLARGVQSLSGGERQRVALGRAILASPQLILLDEPLTGLDDKLKKQIIPYLIKIFDEFSTPFLFISHSLEEMLQLSEEVLELSSGVVVRKTDAQRLIEAGAKLP